jgi:hypothetical protein
MTSNVPNHIHVIIHIYSSYSCGIPCEHVLRISDELRHEMIQYHAGGGQWVCCGVIE